MSTQNTQNVAGPTELPEVTPLPAAVPGPLTNPGRMDSLGELHSSLGNSLLSAATTSGPTPDAAASGLQLSHGNSAVARLLIQRKANGGADSSSPDASAPAPALPGESTASASVIPTETLIVADDVETVGPGQLRKTEFLAQLRSAVCAAAEAELAGTQWSVAGCPYIGPAFAHYATLDGQSLERIIRRYVGPAAVVTDANSLIPLITERVRRSVITWRSTGAVTGVPEGAAPGLTGVGMLGAVGGTMSGALSGAAGVVSGAAAAVGGAVSAVGSLLFKARHGGANDAGDPQAIQAQLGAGHSLDTGIRSRMESAYGQSFSDVRVHTDAGGAALSENLNARAFTVGQHIAFGAGEYSPGTLIGDALIAHELAHVVQQDGAAGAVMQKGSSEQGALEDDADRAAVGAVVSSLDNRKGLTDIPKRALPSLRSGLRLQRCSGGGERRSLADRTRDRDEISDLMGNPEANETEVLRRIDALDGSDAADILIHMGFLQRDSSVNELAGSEAGQRILDRVIRALRNGNLAARTRADAIARILAGRRAPPSLTPSLSQQQELAQINNAINADSASRLAQYQDRALLVPLRLPVQLYQPGFEMSGGVYYDNTMPRLPPGEAGITTGVVWSRPGNVQQSFRYPLNFIRLGPLVLGHTDEYIRSTMWHEFQHYRCYLEARETDAVQNPDSLLLEEELRQPAVGDTRPNLELEATSIQLASDFDRLRDDEVQVVLVYLGKHMANSNARSQFRSAAIDRVRVAVAGDRAKQDRLLRLIGSVGRVATRQLNDLKLAIQNNLAPRPRRPRGTRAPGSH